VLVPVRCGNDPDPLAVHLQGHVYIYLTGVLKYHLSSDEEVVLLALDFGAPPLQKFRDLLLAALGLDGPLDDGPSVFVARPSTRRSKQEKHRQLGDHAPVHR
jgi:hypothetical protein